MTNNLKSTLFLGLLAAVPLMTFDIYQPALPAITNYFHSSHALAQLTLSLFMFLSGISQLIWGPIIDHYGRQRSLSVSLSIFFIANLICIFSSSMLILIIGRALQGFSISCANVVAFSSTRDIENSTKRAKMVSHIAMVISISPIFAPLLGSLIFTWLGWHAIFVFLLLLNSLIFIGSKCILNESVHWTRTFENFSIKQTLIEYLSILKDKTFIATAMLVTGSYTAVMIVLVNAAYLLIDNLHFSPQLFSIIFASNGIVIIGGSYLGIFLRNYRSLVWNIRLGAFLMLLGACITFIGIHRFGLSLLTLSPILIINGGIILLTSPGFSLALTHFTKTAGKASAFLNTFRMCLASLIAAIVSTFIPSDINVLSIALILCALFTMLVSLIGLKEANL